MDTDNQPKEEWKHIREFVTSESINIKNLQIKHQKQTK